MGALGAAALLGSKAANAGQKKQASLNTKPSSIDARETIYKKVFETPFIDTHEHLFDESQRLSDPPHPRMKSKDWSVVFSQLTSADMEVSGMQRSVKDKFFSPKVDPVDKWKLLEPYWPAMKNTGYCQAVRLSIKELYGVDELSDRTVKKVQEGYEKLCRPGFYKHILCERANIESCQVNSMLLPFRESDMPELLMQDIGIDRMIDLKEKESLSEKSGIGVANLSDWHRVIDFWFDKYGKYAVAIKSRNAYQRDIDFDKVSAEKVEHTFEKKLASLSLTDAEEKALQDHLFWYAVNRANENNLPVKLHTGYLSEVNNMPLGRVSKNPASASDLCYFERAGKTRFVFFHICYPYYEPMIALAKQYSNAYIDMCWSWIVNPVAAKDFLKKYLVCAPTNKIFTFGGDFRPVEPVLGHAIMTRRGVAQALSELVEEGWLGLDDAMGLVRPIMYENARRFFNLDEKEKILKDVKWA
jgi:predicted TIM-barrel fold metal-dependent hydrolase